MSFSKLCSTVCIALVLGSGCAPARNTGAPGAAPVNSMVDRVSGSDQIDVLYQTAQCENISRGGFLMIDDAVVLEDLLLPHGPKAAKKLTGQVDFSRQKVLVVDFGASASGGQSYGLQSDKLEGKGGVGVVRLKLPGPVSPDKRQTQNVTHSCSFYVLPNQYPVVEIRSEFDDLLTQF